VAKLTKLPWRTAPTKADPRDNLRAVTQTVAHNPAELENANDKISDDCRCAGCFAGVRIRSPRVGGLSQDRSKFDPNDRIPRLGRFSLSVVGDGDTDLAFRLYNPYDRLVHEDDPLSDLTVATINSGCGMFHLYIENLGDVYNMVGVMVSN
jgi:hypothetical protein